MDIGAKLTEFDRRLKAVERSSRLSSASLDDTALEVRDTTGSLRALVGQQADGTTAVNVVNGPTPPAPSPPYVASVLGGVAAAWDGTFADEAVLPLDFSRVEVHASSTASFTPTAATLQNTIETPQGAVVTISTETPLYIRLVTRNTSGTASTASAQNGPIAPALIVADDVADGIITGSKLAADAIDGKTITGATLRTAATGQRVVIAPSETVGENAVRLYSGVTSETEPGELIAVVDTDAGHPRPSLILWAPTVEPFTSAGLKLISGGGTENDQGEFELTTGTGTDYFTRLYAYAADGAAGLGQLTVQIEQPGIAPNNIADFTMTADTFGWTDARNKGFHYSSDPDLDTGFYTDVIHCDRLVSSGTKQTPTYTADFAGGSAASTRYAPLTYRITAENNLHVVGHFRSTIARAAGAYSLFTLPTGYRPAELYSCAAIHVSNTDAWKTAFRLNVDSTGSVNFATPSAISANDGFYVNALIPLT